MGAARSNACRARLAAQAEAGKQRGAGDVGERGCTFNWRCRRGRGYTAEDGTGLREAARETAAGRGVGSRGRQASQGSCRSPGNHGCGGEVESVSRSAFVEKRFTGTGDHTMTKDRDQG